MKVSQSFSCLLLLLLLLLYGSADYVRSYQKNWQSDYSETSCMYIILYFWCVIENSMTLIDVYNSLHLVFTYKPVIVTFLILTVRAWLCASNQHMRKQQPTAAIFKSLLPRHRVVILCRNQTHCFGGRGYSPCHCYCSTIQHYTTICMHTAFLSLSYGSSFLLCAHAGYL
jgi:hypothetical protein